VTYSKSHPRNWNRNHLAAGVAVRRYGTTVDVIDRPDDSLSRQSIPVPFKNIAAIIGLSMLLLRVALLLMSIIQHR
jgi:hypothetical protein